MSLDDLYAAMLKGGFKFEAKSDVTAKRALAVALSKNTAFTKLPNDDIGLSEWYALPGKKKGNGKSADSTVEASEEETYDDYKSDFAEHETTTESADEEHGVAAPAEKKK
jgi:hypothetical protein